jgi:hypothetical protein
MMRRSAAVFASLLLIAGASGVVQAAESESDSEEAADDSDDGIDIGGYGGLGARYARLLDRNTVLGCIELAVFFDQTLSIGPGGCSTFMSPEASSEDVEADRLELNFGATTVRYHFMTFDSFNLSLGVTAGAGSIDLVSGVDDVRRTDSLIVVEPEVGAHTMATSWMRVSAVGAYRFVSGVDIGGVTNSDVSGFSVGVNAHFGWF